MSNKEFNLVYECKASKKEILARKLIDFAYMLQDQETKQEFRVGSYQMRKGYRFIKNMKAPVGIGLKIKKKKVL